MLVKNFTNRTYLISTIWLKLHMYFWFLPKFTFLYEHPREREFE